MLEQESFIPYVGVIKEMFDETPDVKSFRVVGLDGKKLFEDISFLITRGEHAFIYGKNGCGKSTLIKILASKIAADNGTFEFGNNIKIAYYDQENQNLDPKKTVLDEMWDTDRKMTQTEVRKILAQFLFLGEDVQKTVSEQAPKLAVVEHRLKSQQIQQRFMVYLQGLLQENGFAQPGADAKK